MAVTYWPPLVTIYGASKKVILIDAPVSCQPGIGNIGRFAASLGINDVAFALL